jgi:hypothetical protein
MVYVLRDLFVSNKQMVDRIKALASYVLQAVHPELCTTGMLANFNQALKAW